MQHLTDKDLKFKQIFQGIPQNRKVTARHTEACFTLSHKAKYQFAPMSEIQYELRKKH